jgi:class 3 adenylate cyclase/pimeloyl-ACP methyl ester carboxylesterase
MLLVEIRDTRFARTPDDVYIAYQVVGDGPIDLVWQLDIFGNIDLIWELPGYVPAFRELGFVRLILHDRRGTGLSSRNVPPPNLETRVADLGVVLEAANSERPVLGGGTEGGAVNAHFAATYPDRVQSLIWYGPAGRLAWAPDYPWGLGPDYFERDQRSLELWGTSEYGELFRQMEGTIGHIVSEEAARVLGMLTRQTVTPDVAKELARTWYETDIRSVLPSVQTPALLITHDDQAWAVEEMEYVASLMPNAKSVTVPGQFREENFGPVLDAMRDFVGVMRPPVSLETVLSTVLFTDIVGSTERQAQLGDRGWKELVERHHSVVRDALERWRGVENDTAGDGFYATFDGPARAIRCALEATERVRGLGIEVRAGVHTGECELIDGKIGGITVSIGSRIASTAGPSEVRISQTVKDLVAGSGLTFEDAGEHELKGVPDRWHLYRVVSGT